MTSTLLAQTGHDGNGALRMIPGAYERNTLARRQPGAMGRAAHDADHMPAGAGTMSDVTIAERRKEGGGGISQRRKAITPPA